MLLHWLVYSIYYTTIKIIISTNLFFKIFIEV